MKSLPGAAGQKILPYKTQIFITTLTKGNSACCFVLVWNLVSEIKGKTMVCDFKNRVLRKIFWHKRKEVTGGWIKLHNEKLYNIYSSSNIIRVIKSKSMKGGGVCCRNGKRNAYRAWGENLQERDYMEDLGVDWKIILKIDLKETGWEGCLHTSWWGERHLWVVVNTAMNVQVPPNAEYLFTSWGPSILSRRILLLILKVGYHQTFMDTVKPECERWVRKTGLKKKIV